MRSPAHVARARRILRETFGGRRGSRGQFVTAEPLSGFVDRPVIRLRYPLGELTIHEDETTAVVIWILEQLVHGHGEPRPKLPVPEYWEPPWQPDYRWTLRAWQVSP